MEEKKLFEAESETHMYELSVSGAGEIYIPDGWHTHEKNRSVEFHGKQTVNNVRCTYSENYIDIFK